MRYVEPDPPGSRVEITTEEQLRKENQELKRRLQELQPASHAARPVKIWHPSRLTIVSIVFVAAIVLVTAFLGGYIPLQKRKALITNEAHEEEQALPRVD